MNYLFKNLFHFVDPPGKPMSPHLLRVSRPSCKATADCQGLALDNYSFALGRLSKIPLAGEAGAPSTFDQLGFPKNPAATIQALVLFWCFIFLFWGCAPKAPPSRPSGYPKPYKVGKTWYQPIPHAKDFRQKGVASWYGKKFHGRKTSNGETYDMFAMTAAHKTLPFDTHVRVNNLSNAKTTVVRVNDRGPFVRGRIIDLSYSAAKNIGLVGPGTAKVEIVALGAAAPDQPAGFDEPKYIPQDYYSGKFTFQVMAFRNREFAERLKTKLERKYKNVHISPFDNGTETLYRVRVGLSYSLEQAAEYESVLIQDGFKDAFIVAE